MAICLKNVQRRHNPGHNRGRISLLVCAVVFVLAWLLGWLLVWLPVASAAPAPDFAFLQPEFEQVGDGESIPEGAITALAQDARGLLWIGTQLGLIVYDGYRFRRFMHMANDPASLAGDYVSALWVARDGRIWIGTTSDGLSVFDPATERFEQRAHDPKQPGSLSAGKIWALTGDAKGGIWLATDHGLNYLPPSGKQIVHYRHDDHNPNSLLDDQVYSLLIDRRGRLWVGTASGLQRFSAEHKNFERVADTALHNASQAGGATEAVDIQSLFEAQDGKLWLGTSKKGAAWLAADQVASATPGATQWHWLALSQENKDVRQTRASPAPGMGMGLSHPWITCMAQLQPDQIWLASNGGGINIVAASDGKVLQHLRHDPALAGSLALDSIRALLFDRTGLLWVGNWGSGLQRHDSNNKMLRLLRHGITQPNSLSHADVRSMHELADGKLLFGSSGNGIDIIDRERGLIGGYRSGQAGAMPDATIRAITQTTDGAIWAGTQQAGALRMLPGSQVWQAVSGLPGPQVRRFLQARNGDVWVATNRGAARWKVAPSPAQTAGQPGPVHFAAVPDDNGKPMQSLVFALAEDGQGRIWVGSERGLWVWTPGATGLHGIHPEPGQKGGLISDFVTGLLIDSRDRMWVATGKGLERLLQWDGKRAEFQHVNPLLGQTERALDGNLLEDKTGRIWTELAVIDPDKMQMVAITRADGFDIGTKWLGAYAQTRDGLLLRGGSQGVAIINPALFQAWHYAPPLVVTELKINGQRTPLGELALPPGSQTGSGSGSGSAPALTLRSGERNFVLEFAALDYTAPKRIRYQYRLQGYDKNWIDTDAEHRSAAYGNLWPGLYTLQVRGSNRAGEWSRHELRIAVHILPLWYQTWWFVLLALAALLGIGAGGVRWRVAKLRAKARCLQNVVDARTGDILKLGKIGRELTATLDTEQAFERLYKQVSARMDTRVFSIGIYNEATAQIMFVYDIENAQRFPVACQDMGQQACPAVWCVREKQELIALNNTELVNYLCTVRVLDVYAGMETVVYLPLMIEQQVIGCLSVQSLQSNAYDKDQLEFLRVLASYTAIALSNSMAHGNLAQAHKRLQETQQQMVLQEKMAGLGILTAGVAHEINNPTNFVHVAAQIQRTEIAEFQQFVTELIDDDTAPEIMLAFDQRFKKMEENVRLMLNGTERIKGIVKDLRSFTRLDESAKKSVHLSECVNSTLNLVRTSWLEKVEFITEFADDPEIECWPALLNQVLMNLLVNACQAIEQKQQQQQQQKQQSGSPRPGKLWLRLKLQADSQSMAIIFEDDGIGMDEKTQMRILEPFYTTKEVGSGTGLGLSIAFSIVQKHGGNLSFTSTQGQGSCFTVSLPLCLPPGSPVNSTLGSTVGSPQSAPDF